MNCLREIRLEGIGRFDTFEWMIDPRLGLEEVPRWNVVTGENGSGKTTFLQTVALSFIGEDKAKIVHRGAFRPMIRRGKENGIVCTHIETTKNRYGKVKKLESKLRFSQKNGLEKPVYWLDEKQTQSFFSAAYGFSGQVTRDDTRYDFLCRTDPVAARHLTVFGKESVLESASQSWIKSLNNIDWCGAQTIRDRIHVFLRNLWNEICEFKLKDLDRGLIFWDDEYELSVFDLGTGHQMLIGFVIDLIRHMVWHYDLDVFNNENTQIVKPGIVLLDDLGNNLHPSLQRMLGKTLTKAFPNVQFVLTTHNIFVCQGVVPSNNVSVYKLPSLKYDYDMGEQITGYSLDRLVYGDLLEAYSSGTFGRDVNRSDDAKVMLERLAELNVKSVFEPLSDEEQGEREGLQAIFGTRPHFMGDTYLSDSIESVQIKERGEK